MVLEETENQNYRQCSTSSPKKKPRRSISTYLDFEFKSPRWKSINRTPETKINDIKAFLDWYGSLPEEQKRRDGGIKEILKDYRNIFVCRMAIEEKEGVQRLGETALIAKLEGTPTTPPEPLSKDQTITRNLFRALRVVNEATNEVRTDEYLKNTFVISPDNLNEWHREIWNGVPGSDAFDPGVPRSYGDGVSCTWNTDDTKHVYVESEFVRNGMEMFTDMFSAIAHDISTKTEDKSIERLIDTIKWAAWTLLYFLCLHPYKDGNGRTARLLANYVLSSIFPFEIASYNVRSHSTRNDYLDALQTAQHCPCLYPTSGRTKCWTFEESLRNGDPGLVAALFLDSCWYNCCDFYAIAVEQLPELLAYPIRFSPPVCEYPENSGRYLPVGDSDDKAMDVDENAVPSTSAQDQSIDMLVLKLSDGAKFESENQENMDVTMAE